MPRKTKKIEGVESEPLSRVNEPQPSTTKERVDTKKDSSKERNTNGQFAKGNAGGPGNPHARSCARMLQIFRDSFSDEEMNQIFRMLYVKAVGGDISAAKIVLSYKIGKPLPAPHPDSIDRDEWDHYQKDVMEEKEMKHVLSNFPTHVGNDIVRVSLPIMTAGRLNDFAPQLLKDYPKYEAPATAETDGNEVNSEVAPRQTDDETREGVTTEDTNPSDNASSLPNRKLNGRTTTHNRPASTKRRPRTHSSRSAKAPIPNGERKRGKKRKDRARLGERRGVSPTCSPQQGRLAL